VGKLSSQPNQRKLLCEFLRLFYEKGWVSGTGGGICTVGKGGEIIMAPTGVHKERVEPHHLFTVHPSSGDILRFPKDKSLRLSECSPIFCSLVKNRNAGSVMHSHALSAVLAGDLALGNAHVVIEGFEMLKGIKGVNNHDKHLVPVIFNTPQESELLQQIHDILKNEAYQDIFAILVRDHGAYIWGDNIWEAKRHAEVYHFLFEATVSRVKNLPSSLKNL
jgi:methylthioribulose-1-phosphate dehydratase